jgi:hypothetical protein
MLAGQCMLVNHDSCASSGTCPHCCCAASVNGTTSHGGCGLYLQSTQQMMCCQGSGNCSWMSCSGEGRMATKDMRRQQNCFQSISEARFTFSSMVLAPHLLSARDLHSAGSLHSCASSAGRCSLIRPSSRTSLCYATVEALYQRLNIRTAIKKLLFGPWWGLPRQVHATASMSFTARCASTVSKHS